MGGGEVLARNPRGGDVEWYQPRALNLIVGGLREGDVREVCLCVSVCLSVSVSVSLCLCVTPRRDIHRALKYYVNILSSI